MPEVMLRYNAGKPPLSLLPTSLMTGIAAGVWYSQMPTLLLDDTAHVLGFGAKKYTAENWRKAGLWKDVLDCAMRHMHKMFRGETHDLESGIHHAAHVMCNIGFLTEFIATGTGEDNRHPVQHVARDGYKSGTLDIVYHYLLRWKDGEDTWALETAARELAYWYEELTDDDRAFRPGTSEYAAIKATNGKVS